MEKPKEKGPLASVVIPVYNGEKCIFNCLNSLKNQSFSEGYEVIVIDDGSADNTVGEIKRAKLDNLVLLQQGKKGRAAARNLAIKKARGSIICFTDADCIVEKNWIEKLVKELLLLVGSSDGLGVVAGSIVAGSKNIFVVADQLIWLHSVHPSMKRQERVLGSTANMAVEKKVLEKIGGFDEGIGYAEDSDLCARIAKAGYRNIYSPKIIVYHYPERGNLSSFLRQRYNYAIGSTLIFLTYKDILSLGKFFPESPLLLFILIPFYTILSSLFVVKNNLSHSKHVLLYIPLILLGRFVESIGAVKGAIEFRRMKNVS